MRFHSLLRTAVLIAFCCLILALSSGCTSDGPVTPKPVHYNIYATVSNWWGGDTTSTLHVYDAEDLVHIDSLSLPDIAELGAASTDGRYLYLAMWPSQSPVRSRYLEKLDLVTHTVLWTHDGVDVSFLSPVRLLHHSQLIVYGSEVLDAETGQSIRTLDDYFAKQLAVFSGPESGTEVAAVEIDPVTGVGSRVHALDILTGEMRGEFIPRMAEDQPFIGPEVALLHPDKRRVLLVGPRSNVQDAWFVVGDLQTGTLLMADRLSTPHVEIAVSTDGTLAVVADRANSLFGYGWPAIYVYDLVRYKRLTRFESNNQLRYWPGQVRFIDKDHRIVIAPDNGLNGVGWLQTFDLTSLTSEYVVDTPFFDPFMGALAVGPRIEE